LVNKANGQTNKQTFLILSMDPEECVEDRRRRRSIRERLGALLLALEERQPLELVRGMVEQQDPDVLLAKDNEG
jgi:hypothetical protein